MTRILVDGDSCNSIKTIKQVAKNKGIKVLTFCDDTRNIRGNEKYIRKVETGEDAADFALLNETKKGDIVVTKDYGLVAMAMALGAKVLSPDGKIYRDDEIDEMLFRRFLIKKSKRIGNNALHCKYFRDSHSRAENRKNTDHEKKNCFGVILKNTIEQMGEKK